jgi:hypothetical protein
LRSDVAKRNDRNDSEDHPLGLVARLDEGLDHLQALGKLLGLELRGRLGDLHAKIGRDPLEIKPLEQLTDGLRADRSSE